MKNPRPSRLSILGQLWHITYLAKLPMDGEAPTYGITDTGKRTIKIATEINNTPELLQATLLHEVVHAVLAVSGVNALLTERVEEAVAIALEHGLAPLVRLK